MTQFFKTLFLTAALVGVYALSIELANAQDVPAVEVAAGVAMTPLVHTTNSPGESFVYPEGARQGFYVSAHVPMNDVVGLEGVALRTSGRFVALPGKRVYSNEFFGGLRFSDRELSRKIVPYFTTLMGGIYRPYLLSYTGWHWGIQLGMGVNVYASKHVGMNVGVDYKREFRGFGFDEGSAMIGIALK